MYCSARETWRRARSAPLHCRLAIALAQAASRLSRPAFASLQRSRSSAAAGSTSAKSRIGSAIRPARRIARSLPARSLPVLPVLRPPILDRFTSDWKRRDADEVCLTAVSFLSFRDGPDLGLARDPHFLVQAGQDRLARG